MTFLKRNYNLLVVPSMIIIFITVFSGFTVSDEDKIVKSLLTERTFALQDGLYDVVSYNETERRLMDIETYPLIASDMENLKLFEATDLSRVVRMRFTKIEKQHSIMGYITYEIEIIWDMTGPEGDYESRGTYHTVLKKTGDKILLSKFVLIN